MAKNKHLFSKLSLMKEYFVHKLVLVHYNYCFSVTSCTICPTRGHDTQISLPFITSRPGMTKPLAIMTTDRSIEGWVRLRSRSAETRP